MGGSSSKTRKTKYEVSHTADSETVNNSSKVSTRRGSSKKNSVKIKQKKGLNKSKSFKGQAPQAGIEDTSDKANENVLLNSPVYRKKSSCPSCDAKDILLGKNRSRSNSEKSLRFSDFNKVLRKARINEWEMKPLEVPLYDADEPMRDDICYICEVYTGSHVRSCRVCCRAYHDSCLAKIGHPLRESCRRLIAGNKWSCHQCVSLNHLLTQEEVREVLEALADLNISRDDITEANYLKFCKYSLERKKKLLTSEAEQNSMARFRSVLAATSSVISYTQFLNLESIRILNMRCKDSLVHLLTKAELAEARKIFLRLDSHKTGVITRSALQSTLLLNKSRTKTYYPDDSIMYIDEDQNSPVTWTDFLREIAISFLGQRPNLDDTDSPGSAEVLTEDSTFSSQDSLDVDENRYCTCNSDLGPGVVDKDSALSKMQTSLDEAILDKSADVLVMPLDSSTSLLYEIHSVMERDRCRHHLHDRRRESGPSQNLNPAHEGEFPQTPAGADSDQLPSNHSPRSPGANKPAGMQTGGHWAGRDPERSRSSPYNDNCHTPIPWDDVERTRVHRGGNDGNTKPAYRRSEIISRQNVASSGQTRAVSHVGCRQDRNSQAPAYGNIVGRINSEEWRC